LPSNFSRRNFIKLSGLTIGGLALAYRSFGWAEVPPFPCDLERTVVRPDDLLYLTFRFINLNCIPGSSATPQLRRQNPAQPAFIIVKFPSQHLAEEVLEGSSLLDGRYPDHRVLDARLSNPTFLSFRIDTDLPIDYSLEELLGQITNLPLQSVKPMPPDNFNVVSDADKFNEHYAEYFKGEFPITRIEIPYRMILTPDGAATVCHDVRAREVDQSKRVPVWHTFLMNLQSNGVRCSKQSKALTLLPLATRGLCSPFQGLLSPTGDAKRQVVGLAHQTGRRVEAERLSLSSAAWIVLPKPPTKVFAKVSSAAVFTVKTLHVIWTSQHSGVGQGSAQVVTYLARKLGPLISLSSSTSA
jgi:hypothetical protein